MAELFIHELTVGVGDTGIKAGIIKIATGFGQITEYEHSIIEAAVTAVVPATTIII